MIEMVSPLTVHALHKLISYKYHNFMHKYIHLPTIEIFKIFEDVFF